MKFSCVLNSNRVLICRDKKRRENLSLDYLQKLAQAYTMERLFEKWKNQSSRNICPDRQRSKIMRKD